MRRSPSLLLDMTGRDNFIQINSLRLHHVLLIIILRATIDRSATRLIRRLALNLRRAITVTTIDWKTKFISH